MVFERHYELPDLEKFVLVICGVILVADIASTILHVSWASVAARKDIRPQNKGSYKNDNFFNNVTLWFPFTGLVTLDVISLISLLNPVLPSIDALYYVLLGMECLRLYRVFRFFCNKKSLLKCIS